jgi:hypothetical protein
LANVAVLSSGKSELRLGRAVVRADAPVDRACRFQPLRSACSTSVRGSQSKLSSQLTRRWREPDCGRSDHLRIDLPRLSPRVITYQPQVSFELINFMELIGESMGIHIPDLYKQLHLIGDIDTIIADSADLIVAHGLDLEKVRDVLAQEMAGAG